MRVALACLFACLFSAAEALTMSQASVKRQRRARPASASILSEEAIKRPVLDKRQYRLIKLPNDLRVLLISDPELAAANDDVDAKAEAAEADENEDEDEDEDEDGEEEDGEDEDEDDEEDEGSGKKAACALCVGVGSLSDPTGLDGLAHYVEHAVFMGSAGYPTENGWSAFLAEHGGEDNGETGADHTCCYFEIAPEQLRPAIDRFVDFLAAPSLNLASAQREVKAIESEFQQARQEDGNRHSQLLSHLTAEGHPFHRFMWGDTRSLEQRPAAAGIDMAEKLRDFHSTYYSSRLMSMCILGLEPLDTLQAWAEEVGARLPSHHVARPSFEDAPLPFERTTVPAPSATPSATLAPAAADPTWTPPLWLRTIPIREARTLEMTWYAPSLLGQFRSKPDAVLTHLLGHEGCGSALEALKAEGLATGLSAGVDEEMHCSAAAPFSVDVELTRAGVAKPDRVVEIVLGAIGFLTRLEAPTQLDWVYEELRNVAEMRFAYAETEREIDAVRRHAIALVERDPPADDVLSVDVLLTEWAPAEVAKLLGRLTPERLVVTFSHKDDAPRDHGHGGGEDGEASPPAADGTSEWEVEPWFGTRHTVSRVAPERLASWQAAYNGTPTVPFPAGTPALPPPNPYIATNFELRHPLPPSARRPKRVPPQLLHRSARGLLFHKPDTAFATPKAVVCLELAVARVDAAASSAEQATERTLREIVAKLALEQLNAEAYAATLAGLSYECTASERGWFIQVDGFAHKLPMLLERVVTELARLGTQPCEAATLERVLADYQLALANSELDPSQLALHERLRCLDPAMVTPEEKLGCLERAEATPRSLTAFVQRALGGGKDGGGKDGGGKDGGGKDGGGKDGGGVYLTMYAGGNLDRVEATEAFERVTASLGHPPPLPDPPLIQCAALPSGQPFFRQQPNRNPNDDNAVGALYWQLGADEPRLAGRVSLLEHLLYEPLFDTLRTKQQLGYSVSCEARNTHGCLGFLVTVVSATHAAEVLEARALEALEEYAATLERMPKEEFASNVAAAVENRMLDDKTIEDEAGRFWFEIDMRTFAFERAEAEAAAIRKTSQAELVAWFRKGFLSSAHARRLSIAITPAGGAAASTVAAASTATAVEGAAGAVPTAAANGGGGKRRSGRLKRASSPAVRAAAEAVRDPAAFLASLSSVPRAKQTP